MKRILFVCTGNTCRSPMAEAFLKGLAHEKGLIIAVRSAGISTLDGLPVSSNSQQALSRRGIQHKGSSTSLQHEALQWADLVLTMTTGHKQEIIKRYPDVYDKIFTLKEYVYMDEQLKAQFSELEQLYTELQTKHILGEKIDEQQLQRLHALERSMPSFDIVDPYGGSQAVYDRCADELEDVIFKLVDRLLELRHK